MQTHVKPLAIPFPGNALLIRSNEYYWNIFTEYTVNTQDLKAEVEKVLSMASYTIDEDESTTEEHPAEVETDEELDGFMAGAEDDEVKECAECGAAIRGDKEVVKTINTEERSFCSKECATDFEESVKEE